MNAAMDSWRGVRGPVRLLLALLACAGAIGCELVAGIGEFHEIADASVDAGIDGSLPDGGDPDGDVDSMPAEDAVADTLPQAPQDAGGDACGSPEVCTDGIDNDCNGLVDCADPACAPGYECVPVWPSGFTAPVALFDSAMDGGPAPAAPPCSGSYGTDVLDEHYGPVSPPATCSCACGINCSAPTVAAYSGASCTGAIGQASTPVGACTQVASQSGLSSCGVTSPGGVPSCAPHQVFSLPRWDPTTITAWAGTGRACAPTSARAYFAGDAGGCPSGSTCVEVPPATFGAPHVCLLSPGQVGCPATYPNAHTYYDGGTNNSHCTGACTCTQASALSCSVQVDCYQGTGTCTGSSATVADDAGSCAPTSALGSAKGLSANVTATTTGTCTPGGTYAWNGQGVTASGGETTVCCN